MKKLTVLLMLVAVLLVALGSLAYAATPQDIWDDWLDNGQLDGEYTDEELQAFLNDPTIDQYNEHPAEYDELVTLISGMLSDSDRDEFPLTGFEIGFIALGVVALLGAGLGLRRLARSNK